jgi:hypothetical protein
LKHFHILFLLFTRMYPEVGIALPVAVAFLRLDKVLPFKFYDSAFGYELVLAHMIITLPLTTWVLVGAFDTIPRDLEEQASVDGASRIQTILRVAIAVAVPGIAVATIFAWLASWDEVAYAIYLTLFNRTLLLETVNIVGRFPPPVIATYAMLIALPVVIVNYLMQRWIRADYLAGAVKGWTGLQSLETRGSSIGAPHRQSCGWQESRRCENLPHSHSLTHYLARRLFCPPLKGANMLQRVELTEKSLADFEPVVGGEVLGEIRKLAEPLKGARVVHINATAFGGGVAEIFQTLIPLMRDVGLDAEWQVIRGEDEFFNVTKACHNGLQGMDIPFTEEMQNTWRRYNEMNAQEFKGQYDFVVVHDPQPAGLLHYHGGEGADHWIWRCHIDTSHANSAY